MILMELKQKIYRILNHNSLVFSRRRVVALGIFGLVMMVVLQIWAMNRLAVLGDKITQIERTKASLVRENQLLENTVASRASLQYIQKLADNLGFNSGTNARLKTVLPQELASSH